MIGLKRNLMLNQQIFWEILLNDFKNKQLKKFYKSSTKTSLNNIFPDRSLFKDKKYFPVTLIETGRGCKFNCEFCSINAFYKRTYSTRPIDNIIDEIKRLSRSINWV